MTDHDDRTMPEEAWLDGVIAELREPIERRPGAVDAVVRASVEARSSRVRSPAGEGFAGRIWVWLTRPRLRLSPLSAMAWAGAVSIVALLVVPSFQAPPGRRDAAPGAGALVRHQFVLMAPTATSVALVGDFNAWDVRATPLVRRDGVWTVEVGLRPGRHVYSFVVDGREWVPDASAPEAPDDDFGRPSSVIVVPGRGT